MVKQGEGKTTIVAKGKLIGIEKAEDIVKEEVEKQVKKGEVVDVDVEIESTELTAVGDIPVYKINCSALVTFKRRSGFSSTEVKGKKHIEVQVHAKSGEVVGFKEEGYEPMGGLL